MSGLLSIRSLYLFACSWSHRGWQSTYDTVSPNYPPHTATTFSRLPLSYAIARYDSTNASV